jgi:hypothetical protein
MTKLLSLTVTDINGGNAGTRAINTSLIKRVFDNGTARVITYMDRPGAALQTIIVSNTFSAIATAATGYLITVEVTKVSGDEQTARNELINPLFIQNVLTSGSGAAISYLWNEVGQLTSFVVTDTLAEVVTLVNTLVPDVIQDAIDAAVA